MLELFSTLRVDIMLILILTIIIIYETDQGGGNLTSPIVGIAWVCMALYGLLLLSLLGSLTWYRIEEGASFQKHSKYTAWIEYTSRFYITYIIFMYAIMFAFCIKIIESQINGSTIITTEIKQFALFVMAIFIFTKIFTQVMKFYNMSTTQQYTGSILGLIA